MAKICVSGFKLPSASVMSRYTTALYQAEKQVFAEEIEKAKYVILCADGWTDSTGCSWMSLTYHWVDPETLKLHTSIGHMARIYLLSHTNQALELVLQDYLDWSELSVPVEQFEQATVHMHESDLAECKDVTDTVMYGALIVDGGSNYRALARNMFGEGGTVHCCSHRLQLALKHAFSTSSQRLKDMISMIHRIAAVSKRSPKFSEILRQKGCRKLEPPGDTRWNSHLALVESVVGCFNKLIEAIVKAQSKVQVSFDGIDLELIGISDRFCRIESVEVQTQFHSDLKAFREVLQPFKQITDILGSTQLVSMALVPCIILALIKKLDSLMRNCKECLCGFVASLKDQLQKRFPFTPTRDEDGTLHVPLELLCAAVHPLTGHLCFLDRDQRKLVFQKLAQEMIHFGVNPLIASALRT